MSRSSLCLARFLPTINSSLLVPEHFHQNARNKFEAVKHQVVQAFTHLSIRRFDTHAEFSDIGEVVFIIKKAYCQTLIHYADICMGNLQLVEDEASVEKDLAAKLEYHGLQDDYKHFQYRLKIAFEMVYFPETSLSESTRLLVVQSSYKKALKQWQREMREVCQALDLIAKSNQAVLDQCLLEFENDAELGLGLDVDESDSESESESQCDMSMHDLVLEAANAASTDLSFM